MKQLLFFTFSILTFLASVEADAQTFHNTSFIIKMRVGNRSPAALIGAKVSIIDDDGLRVTRTTDGAGFVGFGLFPEGVFSVEIERAGYFREEFYPVSIGDSFVREMAIVVPDNGGTDGGGDDSGEVFEPRRVPIPLPAPSVASFTPASSVSGVPFTLNITGANFRNGARLEFAPVGSPTSVQSTPLVVVSGSSARYVSDGYTLPGNYYFRVRNADNTLSNVSTFTIENNPSPNPILIVSSLNPLRGSTMRVSLVNVQNPTVRDYLGLFRIGTSTPILMAYTSSCTTTVGAVPKANTTCSFFVPTNINIGNYEIRFFRNDSTAISSRSQTFSVVDSVVLSITAPIIVPGAQATASWANALNPTIRDWVGLFAEGAPDSMPILWAYTSSCTTTPGTVPSLKGSCNLQIPGAGTYYLRHFSNGTFVRRAELGPLEVKVNRDVIGNIDGIRTSDNTLIGWACAKTIGSSLDVHLYANGPAGTGEFLTAAKANLASEIEIANVCQTTFRSYRFEIPLSQFTSTHPNQIIYVHGISPVSDNHLLLSNSGTFRIPALWNLLPGSATDIGIGASNSSWIVGGGGTPYLWNGSTWSQMPGSGASRIDVDPSGNAWTIASNGLVYKWNGSTWIQMPGSGGSDIGIGANGSVWSTSTTGSIYRWNGSTWIQIPGTASRIDVDPNGNAWIVNSVGNIYRWNGTQWILMPGLAMDIGISNTGSVFIVSRTSAGDGNYVVKKFNGTSWDDYGIAGVGISAGAGSLVGVVKINGQIYYRQ